MNRRALLKLLGAIPFVGKLLIPAHVWIEDQVGNRWSMPINSKSPWFGDACGGGVFPNNGDTPAIAKVKRLLKIHSHFWSEDENGNRKYFPIERK